MKLLNRYRGIAFGFLMLMPFHAHADILINCNWVVTSVITMPSAVGGIVTSYQCSDGNVVAATRSVGTGNNICNLNAASPAYRTAGNCHAPQVYRVSSGSSSSSSSPYVCPMAGQVYGEVLIGPGQPAFPADKINQFCQANIYWYCGYTATYLGATSQGQQRYRVSCITK